MTRTAGVLTGGVALLALTLASPAGAHAMRTASLDISEQSPGIAVVLLKAPLPTAGLRLRAEEPCSLRAGEGSTQTLSCPGSVAGALLRLEGLGPIATEAVVWTELADGTSGSMLVTRDRPAFRLPTTRPSWTAVARQFVGLGVKHISTGLDHLLFLLGLVVALRRVRAVMLAETAFTLSHSLSYTASALGWVHIPTGPVEACIALSLVLVALEAARRGAAGPEVVPPLRSLELRGTGLAFVFGLVHGLGFAGGLAETGLPVNAIPPALLGFAAGVELGQVAFLALALGAFALLRSARAWPLLERRAALAATYTVGSVGFFWWLERVAVLWSPLT